MTDREWLEALRIEITRMADDMEVQRRAYMDLIARSEELATDLDKTSAAYAGALAELEWIYASRLARGLARIRRSVDRGVPASGPVQQREGAPIVPVGDAEPRSATALPAPTWPHVNTPPSRTTNPSVSVVVPTRDHPDLLASLLDTLRATDWPDLEVVLVDNGTTDAASLDLLSGSPHHVVRDDGPFNFPRLVQAGVEASAGEVLVLLNNDIEARDPRWLSTLVSALDTPGCGVAGGLLLYPDGLIQHAGLVLVDREPIHALAGVEPDMAPPGALSAARQCTAVTGACMALRRSTWDSLGGLEPLFARNYNDVDLCLRAADAGWMTVIAPAAVLTHKESATRGGGWDAELAAEGMLFRARWRERLGAADRYWPRELDPRTGAPMTPAT